MLTDAPRLELTVCPLFLFTSFCIYFSLSSPRLSDYEARVDYRCHSGIPLADPGNNFTSLGNSGTTELEKDLSAPVEERKQAPRRGPGGSGIRLVSSKAGTRTQVKSSQLQQNSNHSLQSSPEGAWTKQERRMHFNRPDPQSPPAGSCSGRGEVPHRQEARERETTSWTREPGQKLQEVTQSPPPSLPPSLRPC